MPTRLIVFILTLLVIVTFIGFNIENSSDIRIWFGENGLIEDVPIFVSFFIMYLIGVLSSVPFVLRWRIRKKNKSKTAENEPREDDLPKKKKKTRILGSGKRGSEESESSGEEAEEDPDNAEEEDG